MTSSFCPYVGLQPFRAEDEAYFFGREREIRVISSNLLAQPLTVVYGASGVGKSSVLRAGVLPYLRASAKGTAIYYNTWQSTTFISDLTRDCERALDVAHSDRPFDEIIAEGGQRTFLLLDQFEELLLYHAEGPLAAQFDALFARLVNRGDVVTNVLVGIREDGLARFDQRFSIRIDDLLGNTVPLQHLGRDAGRRAILEPLRVFNERTGLKEDGWRAEDDLADEVLRQARVRHYAETGERADGHTKAAATDRLEAPFLQLVLRRLWDEESSTQSRVLRADTLRRIGGAGKIVDQHVTSVLNGLPHARDRAIAAGMFRVLVTKSRSKISQATSDLVDYADAPEEEVRPVLAWLANKPESRILRRLESPERYEIFHDVLAQPILDWRRDYIANQELVKQQQETERSRRELQRLRWMLAGMLVLAVVAAGLAWYGLYQRGRANENALTIVRTENTARAARESSIAQEAELRAQRAAAAGQMQLAKEYQATADAARREQLEAEQKASAANQQLTLADEARDRAGREALQKVETLERERSQLQTRISTLEGELDSLRKASADAAALRSELNETRAQISSLTKELEQLRKQVADRAVRGLKLGESFRDCPDCPEMLVIPAGSFTMGSATNDRERFEGEDAHQVSVDSFGLSKFEITRTQFEVYVKESGRTIGDCGRLGRTAISWRAPGFEQTGDDPVVCVSWDVADAFVNWLSGRSKATYRLPTEAEWEYAARARTITTRYWGNELKDACQFANVADQTFRSSSASLPIEIHQCSDGFGYTAPIGRFKPNQFGLYDMLGNVKEWTQDCWSEDYARAPTDGTAALTGDCRNRVMRGGSWAEEPRDVRSANRSVAAVSHTYRWVGLRVARTLR